MLHLLCMHVFWVEFFYVLCNPTGENSVFLQSLFLSSSVGNHARWFILTLLISRSLQTPTTISLPLRFWDLSMAQYRILDLQCSYQMTPETPAPVTPSVSPTPPSTTKGNANPPVVPKPRVICSSDLMIVELASGPISGIVVKGVCVCSCMLVCMFQVHMVAISSAWVEF